jgi:hypothetical protein
MPTGFLCFVRYRLDTIEKTGQDFALNKKTLSNGWKLSTFQHFDLFSE